MERSNGCGCKEPTQVDCCELDCLVAPRFFCGQLLTDRDLTALMEWTRHKTGLARYRDGWGVVCGLDLSCDQANPGGILVSPGYALSCCGDDIVVCEDARLDLSSACDLGPDPCEELEPNDWRHAVDRPRAANRGAKHARAEGSSGADGADVEPRAVDIYISYREEASDPQAALARSACGETGRCEFARTRETYSLQWEAGGSGDPLSYAAQRWRERYDEALDVIDAFRGSFGSLDGEGAAIRTWLLQWIDAHHPHHFCFLRDRICAAEEDSLTDESRLSELLFWIAQDRRNEALSCSCQGCGPHTGGVPLGRVWVTAGASKGHCQIAAIDPFPPYRRPLLEECWPAPLGYVNAAQVVWHRRSEACTRLADLGVRISKVVEFEPPPTLAELRDALACDPMVRCGEERTLLAYEVEPLGERVVGLCMPSGAPPAPKGPKVSIKKSGEPAQGVRGTAVDYTFEVTNEGDEAFAAVVTDDQLGEIGRAEVAPGATETFTTNVDVPGNVEVSFVNTATVTATGPGGTASAQASHEFRIVEQGEPPSINVALRAPTAVQPGSQIPYTLLVQNDGPVDVRAQVSDSLGALPAAAADIEIAAADVKSFRYQYRPLPNESTVEETVTALATSADGQEARDEETITTKVSRGAPLPATDVRLRDIDGIGETREKQLIEAGIDSVQKLVEADAAKILAIVGPPVTEDQVKRWQEQGKQLLSQ
jgi:predicted flap endonuclease-1-like 5' DNA nuclease